MDNTAITQMLSDIEASSDPSPTPIKLPVLCEKAHEKLNLYLCPPTNMEEYKEIFPYAFPSFYQLVDNLYFTPQVEKTPAPVKEVDPSLKFLKDMHHSSQKMSEGVGTNKIQPSCGESILRSAPRQFEKCNLLDEAMLKEFKYTLSTLPSKGRRRGKRVIKCMYKG